mgnify:CR=1 FL=1
MNQATLKKTKRKWLWVGLCLCAIVLILLPYMMDRERLVLDKKLRQKAPGHFTKLSTTGSTHFRTWGNPKHPALILVHGFNGPLTTWNKIAPELAKAGYYVLAYDLAGRGFSDRPRLKYELSLFVKQLQELLQNQKLTKKPVTLIGSSFGCVVSTAFALRYPKQIKDLVLIGPAGFPAPSERMKWLLKIPYLSDYLYRIIGDRMMYRATRKYYVHPERYPEAHKDFLFQQSVKGFKYAALSTLRNAPLHHNEKNWAQLGKSKREVLLLWGKKDVSFPYKNTVLAKKLIPQAQLVTVEKAAHLPHYELPQFVQSKVLGYLAKRFPPFAKASTQTSKETTPNTRLAPSSK